MSEGFGFECEFSVRDLLGSTELPRLQGTLDLLLGSDAALVAQDGETLWGEAPQHAVARVAIALEIEPLAWLVSGRHAAAQLGGIAALIRQILMARARYLMASDLHLEAIKADFEALRVERDALAASEARYRALASELEQRVAQQVELIDERQRQLYQAEKLASVGQLAAGVAHEINNPIGFVRSNLASAQRYVETVRKFHDACISGDQDPRALWKALDIDFLVADLSDILAESIGGIDRVARIVRDLKGFSSIDRPQEDVRNLNDNLREVCAMLDGQKPPHVALQLRLGEPPLVMCLPGHINQVFLNVLTNALQAVGSEGEIVVGSACTEDGEQACFTVRDSGTGISAQALVHVFDPFFTTRPVGQGTGLGLSVARDIVRAHGGDIRIASPPPEGGPGTLVSIVLPAV